jgi:hypothetical protein
MPNADFASFEPKTRFTRREFVMTTLATGFAAAVQPVSAQTQITTDAQRGGGWLEADARVVPRPRGRMIERNSQG